LLLNASDITTGLLRPGSRWTKVIFRKEDTQI